MEFTNIQIQVETRKITKRNFCVICGSSTRWTKRFGIIRPDFDNEPIGYASLPYCKSPHSGPRQASDYDRATEALYLTANTLCRELYNDPNDAEEGVTRQIFCNMAANAIHEPGKEPDSQTILDAYYKVKANFDNGTTLNQWFGEKQIIGNPNNAMPQGFSFN